MKQADKRNSKQEKNRRQARTSATEPMVIRRLKEGVLIFSLAFAAFVFIALFSYNHSDPGWSHIGMQPEIHNAAGKVGAWVADFSLYFLGYMAYLLPLLVVYSAWLYLRKQTHNADHRDRKLWLVCGIGFSFIVIAGSALATLAFSSRVPALPVGAGGVLGEVTGLNLALNLDITGSVLLLLAILLSGVTLCTGLSWLKLVDRCGYWVLLGAELATDKGMIAYQQWLNYLLNLQTRLQQQQAKPVRVLPKAPELKRVVPQITLAVPYMPVEKELTPLAPVVKRRSKEQGNLPPLSLLDEAQTSQLPSYTNEGLEQMSRDVEERLADFNIEAHVVAVHPGPVVTRFELQLAPGLKVSRIATLAKDLARSLSVISVRVVEVIPGKSVIGLELPNEIREVVRLSETLSSKAYQQAESPLSLVLGKDIAGHPVVVNLAKMPHLLVAGTTGSGKSVGLNVMLLSILYKATPEQVRLIMIDPKMLELSIYADIPHLLAPVVTDMKEAANALRWCVAEMEKRYKVMSAMGVRNITGFNAKIEQAIKANEPIVDPFWLPEHGGEPSPLTPLPFIVVVIDELADMMMVVGKKVEDLIARIAQKARAAGIHMILATQRPSVDVLTGLIKANIPTRIAFQVSSKIDSRTILDQQGAEQLLGYGDMLYLAPGSGIPTRVHGAFVDDHEVHNVVNFLKRQGKPDYIIGVVEHDGSDNLLLPFGQEQDTEQDPLYDQAVQFVIDTRRASISSVQRRLKIGYNRAARMIEQMENAGLVSPMEGNGNREVLIPASQES